MANHFANIKGISLLQAPRGMNNGAIAVVSFDLYGATAWASGDTVELGGGGYNQEVANTASLATIIANRLRNGGSVTLLGTSSAAAVAGPITVGYQAGTAIYANTTATPAAVSSGNITGIILATTATGSTPITSLTTAPFDSACAIAVAFVDSVG